MYRRMIGVVLCMFVFASAAWAQQDPFVGTWKQNISKSKCDPGSPPRNPQTFKRASTPGGAVKTTILDAQGNATDTGYTASYDGKDYPIKGSAISDTVALRRIDANTQIRVDKKADNVVRMARGVVSKDGKTYTVDSIGINAQGQAFHCITVYDKQ